MRTHVTALLSALSLACGESSPTLIDLPESASQGLAPLASPCVFTASTGSLVIVLAAGEQGYLERRLSDSALLINGDLCNSAGGAVPFAKSNTALSATVTGDASGGETFVLDLTNGTFLKGTALAPGLSINLAGGGTDELQVRLSGNRDVVRAGANGWDLSGDGVRDFTVINADSITATLGDGDDVFSAAGGGSLGAAETLPLVIYGGPGDDLLTGGDGDDSLFGDLGTDTLNGGTSLTDSDTYSGGAGTDTVTYATRSGAVTITVGASANDGFSTETDDVTADVEVVVGGSGNDAFTGWTGPQTFFGGAGDDTFHMGLLASTGAGPDTIRGEAGEDTADYAARLEAVTVTMDLGVANDGNAGNGESDNVHSDVEHFLCPTAAVVCIVTGNSADNHFTGGGGADVLSGGAGDDTFFLSSSAGADVISGGTGIDRVDFSTLGASLDVRMDDVASVTHGKRLGLDVEDLTCPTASACTVTGNALANHVMGSTQLDTISTLGGDDLVETRGGADAVDCGDGSDILIGAGAAAVGTTCEL